MNSYDPFGCYAKLALYYSKPTVIVYIFRLNGVIYGKGGYFHRQK